jgi:hypothetical protein
MQADEPMKVDPSVQEVKEITKFLDFLDKEMAIMGILSTFSVAVVSLFLNAIGSADLTNPEKTLFSKLWSYEQWYILVGSGFILGAAGCFYAQRNMLAWYYGQITLAMEAPNLINGEAQSRIQLMKGANHELAWIPNRAAFRCLWLGLFAYGFAFLNVGKKIGWEPLTLIVLSLALALGTLIQAWKFEDKPRKTFFGRHSFFERRSLKNIQQRFLRTGNSIDALVEKQLASGRQADTLFKDAVSIVEIYRKKHPELDRYIPSVESTQREIKVRDASSEDSNSHYRFHIEVVDGDPRYGVALDQEEPSYLDHSEWQKQFHLRLAKTIATIIVERGSEK